MKTGSVLLSAAFSSPTLILLTLSEYASEKSPAAVGSRRNG